MRVESHKDLDVWKRSMDLVTEVYKLTQKWPVEEKYGLTSQLRRAAVSIPSNIAEGSARGSRADFSRFLNIAQGSLAEVETQLEIAYRVDLEERSSLFTNEIISLRRMLSGLKKSLVSK